MNENETGKIGRPRELLPRGVTANAFALWLMGNEEWTVESLADLLGRSPKTVYGWRRGTGAPPRAVATTIERLSGGAVLASSWD